MGPRPLRGPGSPIEIDHVGLTSTPARVAGPVRWSRRRGSCGDPIRQTDPPQRIENLRTFPRLRTRKINRSPNFMNRQRLPFFRENRQIFWDLLPPKKWSPRPVWGPPFSISHHHKRLRWTCCPGLAGASRRSAVPGPRLAGSFEPFTLAAPRARPARVGGRP